MTAQPEVVWVLVEEENGEPVYWLETEAFAGYTPYVSQASLTAALAERDEARSHKAEMGQIIETIQRELLAHDEEVAAVIAERDKLAKELADLQLAVRVADEAVTSTEGVGLLYCLRQWNEPRLTQVIADALTAQAAQGGTE